MAIPQAFLEELQLKTDIVDVVSSYVTLNKRGNRYWGLCPFHSEKTPSFSVLPERQMYYCFGCHKGGGVVNFVMEQESVGFVDAVEILARRAGLEVPDSHEGRENRQRRERLFALNKEAARFFHENLSNEQARAAVAYLRRRGLSRRTVTNFGLGYALDSWDSLMQAMLDKGFSKRELLDTGLVVESKKGSLYDRFRNRVIFPIIDVKGSVIGFGGRVLDDSVPKYLNSPDTPVYNKSRNLFALNIAKKSRAGRLILTEGYMDTIALHQAGFDCAVASLGTSLTEDHARLIARYTSEVILAYDGDTAGVKAAQRAITILNRTGLQVRVLKMTGAKDPDEFIQKFGRDAFQKLLDGSENHMEYRLSQLRSQYHFEDPGDKVAYLQKAAALIAPLPSPVEREIYGGQAAELAGVERDTMLAEIKRQRSKQRWKQKKQTQRQAMTPVFAAQPTERQLRYQDVRSAKAEEGMLGLVMQDPTLFAQLTPIEPEEFSSPALEHIFHAAKNQWETSGGINLTALAQELTASEMSLLTSIMQQPLSLSDAERAMKDYNNLIQRQRLKREITEDGDLLSLINRKKMEEPE